MEATQRLAYLFRRYYTKTCTQREKEELFDLLLLSEHDEMLRRLIDETWKEDFPFSSQDRQRANTILHHIMSRREPESPSDGENELTPGVVRSFRSLHFTRWAAALLGVALISFLALYLHHPSSIPSAPALAVVLPPADQCITLSDGSKVLLHNNARIEYSPEFSEKTREVVLHGEAYFDIRRDPRPFIVHTGAIKTTVLGTAFNINAHNERDIVITVTKGKVKVENGQGEYSILRRDEQLSVDPHSHLKKVPVNAGELLAWKKPYLLFNDVPMKEAMDELAQRYHAEIVFTNPAAENCPVTASFTGGESLEEIIKVLSKVNNMDYTIDHGHIKITGEGCNVNN